MTHRSITIYARIRAFTLVELLCVTVLLGIFGAITVSFVKDGVATGRDRNAVSLANSINSAKKSYELRVSTAATTWAAAADDNASWLLIRDRVSYAESLTLSQFTPPGYTFSLGTSLSTRVTITGPAGPVPY
jgi:prepilin-type N-terminal cleavage/methylation domain-containing protein